MLHTRGSEGFLQRSTIQQRGRHSGQATRFKVPDRRSTLHMDKGKTEAGLMTDGSRYERRLKKQLEQEGYFVIRSAGSFNCDLLAVKDGKVYAYEVKSCKRKKYS